MKDQNETDDIQAEVQRRLKRSIIGLTKLTTGPRRELLFSCLDLVSPPLAYNGVGESRIPGPAGVDTVRKDDRWLCVLSTVGRAIKHFYRLVRTDESEGMTQLLLDLEGVVKHGLASIEVLGAVGTGFRLFNKAAQDEGSGNKAPAKRGRKRKIETPGLPQQEMESRPPSAEYLRDLAEPPTFKKGKK